MQALGVDRKVRGKLVGWTGNEPENRGVQALGVDRKGRGKLVGCTGNESENGGGGEGASFQNLKVTGKNIK